MARRSIVRLVFGIVTLTPFAALIGVIYFRHWNAATTFATLLVGLISADVVVWQGYVIKRQLAFSTYLDLDKEWNSEALVEARQTVHAPDTDEWDHSRLEAILEFFEKLASLFKLAGARGCRQVRGDCNANEASHSCLAIRRHYSAATASRRRERQASRLHAPAPKATT
jgi:hypothetical protein